MLKHTIDIFTVGRARQLHASYCRQKHRHTNTDPKIGPGRYESRPGARGKGSETTKTHVTSGPCPDLKGTCIKALRKRPWYGSTESVSGWFSGRVRARPIDMCTKPEFDRMLSVPRGPTIYTLRVGHIPLPPPPPPRPAGPYFPRPVPGKSGSGPGEGRGEGGGARLLK